MEDDEDAGNRRSAGPAADQPGWAALAMANTAPSARTADAVKLDAARIKSLSAFLGDSLSLGRALSTPIADPPQLTVRRGRTSCFQVIRPYKLQFQNSLCKRQVPARSSFYALVALLKKQHELVAAIADVCTCLFSILVGSTGGWPGLHQQRQWHASRCRTAAHVQLVGGHRRLERPGAHAERRRGESRCQCPLRYGFSEQRQQRQARQP